MFTRSPRYKLASGTSLVFIHDVVATTFTNTVDIATCIEVCVLGWMVAVVDEDALTSCCSCGCRFWPMLMMVFSV